MNCISNSHDSLDTRWNGDVANHKSYDAVVFSVLRVSPEDFAVSHFLPMLNLMYFKVKLFIVVKFYNVCLLNVFLKKFRAS